MKTFTKALNLLLVTLAFVAIAVSASTMETGLMYPPTEPGVRQRVLDERANLPVNSPEWTKADARAFPHCIRNDGRAHPEMTHFLAVNLRNERIEITVEQAAKAYDGNRSAKDANLWIIGQCR